MLENYIRQHCYLLPTILVFSPTSHVIRILQYVLLGSQLHIIDMNNVIRNHKLETSEYK